MVIAGEKRKDVPVCEYESARNANVLANQMKFKALKLKELGQEVCSPPVTSKKRKGEGSDVMRQQKKAVRSDATIQQNLRTSSRLSAARADLQPGNRSVASGDLQLGIGSATSAHLQAGSGSTPCDEELSVREKKNVRGPTKKADIFARQNKPKLKVEINECGQPCGPSGTEFANFIGALVRTKGFPIAHDDWRKVCPQKKYKLWTDAHYIGILTQVPSIGL